MQQPAPSEWADPTSGLRAWGEEVLAELSYTGGTETIREARERVAELVAPLLAGADLDAVRLLTSELVANCHRHGAGPVRIVVTCDHEHVYVAVRDDGDGRVRLREPGVEAPGGYGMHLIEAFAAGWDQHHGASGTTVRFWMRAGG